MTLTSFIIIRLLKLADQLDQKALYNEANIIGNLIFSTTEIEKILNKLGIICLPTTQQHIVLTLHQPTSFRWVGTSNIAPHETELQDLVGYTEKDINRSLRYNLNRITELNNDKVYRLERTGLITLKKEEKTLLELLQRPLAALKNKLDNTDKQIIDYWIETGIIKDRVARFKSKQDLINEHYSFSNSLEVNFQSYIATMNNQALGELFKHLKNHGEELLSRKAEFENEEEFVDRLLDVSRWLIKLTSTGRLTEDYQSLVNEFDSRVYSILE